MRRFTSIGTFLCLFFVCLSSLSACSGATGGQTSASNSQAVPSSNTTGSSSGGVTMPSRQDQSQAKSVTGQSKKSPDVRADTNSGQYLIKSLDVQMSVPDTQQVTQDLQNWLTTTDTRATSAGITYEQSSASTKDVSRYNITLKYSVQSSLYDQIRNYLAGYPGKVKGSLLNLHETVQDVTGDYVDTQSQITNLQTEQKRLQGLLADAKNVSDLVSIEQRLSDVEGQLQQIQGHLKSLQGQTTFYTITIGLTPLIPVDQQPDAKPAWSFSRAFQDAWSASVAFGEALLSLLAWLLSFSIYLIPAGALIYWFWWRRRRSTVQPAPAVATTTTTPTNP